MDSQSEGGGGSPPRSLKSSGSGGRYSDATSATTPSLTLYEAIGHQQTNLKDEFEQLAAYLANEKALKRLYNSL